MLCFQVKMTNTKFVPIDSEWTYAYEKPRKPLDYFVLDRLEPETDYQLIMRVKNELGWSNYSSSHFVFHTPRGI